MTNKKLIRKLQQIAFNLLSLENRSAIEVSNYLTIRYRMELQGNILTTDDVLALDRVESIMYGLEDNSIHDLKPGEITLGDLIREQL